MTTTTAPTRYTINLDGTLEKWYLEHDGGETIYLRKTPRPKWNCGMKEFPAARGIPRLQNRPRGAQIPLQHKITHRLLHASVL